MRELNFHRSLFDYTVSRVKRLVPDAIKPMLKRVYPVRFFWNRPEPADWPIAENRDKVGLAMYGYSLYSQNGEDGILRFIFDNIGFESRRFVEFGFGAVENNSLRLVLHERFGGVFIDGSDLNVSQFNRAARSVGVGDAKAICAFLTLANLDDTVRCSGVAGEIDLLSIDVDGNDYWFWEALTVVSPRVVIIEYNASMGADLSVTVPYDPSFDRLEKHPSTFYHGASLVALERLGNRKGYLLVGCDEQGVNAFFIRSDCLRGDLAEVSAKAAYRPHGSRVSRGFSVDAQFGFISSMPLVQIE